MEYHELFRRFSALYGPGPVRLFSAPARINLIGEHIDYNGGFVFPAAISLRSACMVRARTDGRIRLASTSTQYRAEADISALKGYAGLPWGGYQLGVLSVMQDAGFVFPGMDLLFDETVPHGGGLSASAAIELAMGCAAAALSTRLPQALLQPDGTVYPVQLALLAQRAENEYVGMNCGIMDQYASAMGKAGQALLLNCADLTCRYAPVELSWHGLRLMILNTNKPHDLVRSAYNQRRAECEEALCDLQRVRPLRHLCDLTPVEYASVRSAIRDPICEKRACHVVQENARTLEAFSALLSGDMQRFARLLIASHVSLRDLYEVTGQELDALFDAALAAGALGARMMGGGFGGCALALVPEGAAEIFRQETARAYTAKTDLLPSFYEVELADGAGEVAFSQER